MKHRRRVDWSIVLGERAPPPTPLPSPLPSAMDALLSSVDEMRALEEPDAIVRRTVEMARDRLGLARAGIFLFDETRDLMLGTWGSDLHGQLVDERDIMYAVTHHDREAFRRAEEEGVYFTVFEDCPIVEHQGARTVIGGRGWGAWTPIRSARSRIGMLFNGVGLTGSAVDADKQAQAAILCFLLGTVLDPSRGTHPAQGCVPHDASSPRRLAIAAAKMLAEDPTMSATRVAEHVGVSLGRLTHVFKSVIGMSIVDYRNRIRLERFTGLLEDGERSISKSALAAGFGSYAQFHRVFRAARGLTPRAYLRLRA